MKKEIFIIRSPYFKIDMMKRLIIIKKRDMMMNIYKVDILDS